MLAELVVIGYLGQDPEMRYTPDGTPVTNFSVAASRKWNNADGSPGEETTWFRCTAWRRMAEVVNEYLKKGRLVYLKGTLKPEIRVWEDNGGNPRASYEVTVREIKFLGGGNGSSAGGAPVSDQTPPPDLGEDEIPF
jgi:single-strand DNA-binding protein